MPRVSVIIPAYNAEETLGEALQSVRAQTYSDWEAIVVDDASADETASVAEGFGDGFRVIRCRENGGVAAARNVAVSAAEGELLAFLDADDLWKPEFLDAQVALYDRSEAPPPGIGIVACKTFVLGPDGIVPGAYGLRAPFRDPLTLSGLLEGCSIMISGAIIPSAPFERAGGFSTDRRAAEDFDLFIRLLELGYEVVYNPEPLAVYRVHDASTSDDPAQMARFTALVYQRALDRGRLDGRQRRIASRRLRHHRMAEDIGVLTELRGSGQYPSLGHLLGMGARAARLAVDEPRQVFRSASRALFGKGIRSGRVQEAVTRNTDKQAKHPDDENKASRTR
jgi:glycosyltransferase involved in cell wall biosynthesis